MKTKVKYDRLKPTLPKEMTEALRNEGFFIESDAVVKRSGYADTKAKVDESERSVIRYISTREMDRDNEILDPKGIDYKLYNLNPVVMWAHDYSEMPIGKNVSIEVDDYGVKAKTIYAETEKANDVFNLIKGGFLNTASVGFIPKERIWKGQTGWEKTVAKYNELWETDIEKTGAEIITTKWTLLEYSDVPIPSNPYALTLDVAKSLHLSTKTIEELKIKTPKRIIAIENNPIAKPKKKTIIVHSLPTLEKTTTQKLADLIKEELETMRGRV